MGRWRTRKVFLGSWVARLLDMPLYQASKLFCWKNYSPEAVRAFLQAHGYTPPPKRPRGRPRKGGGSADVET